MGPDLSYTGPRRSYPRRKLNNVLAVLAVGALHAFATRSGHAGAANATSPGPIVNTSCGSWQAPQVLCINQYGSLMPGNFSRTVNDSIPGHDTYPSTVVPADPSFAAVRHADFLVFDETRAGEILGDDPVLEHMFDVALDFHEAPVYVPDLHRLYVTPVGSLQQILIDLAASPPTLDYVTATPPLYSPTGGQYRDGLIYYSCNGGNSTGEYDYRPGIYTFDPHTGESNAILNNYFGYWFNTADDMVMQSNGDIWFTDNSYSWNDHTSTMAPELMRAVYRFRPSTGLVQVVTVALLEPNGIGFSPDEKTLYVTDSGAGTGPMAGPASEAGLTYTSIGPRLIYAFDVISNGTQINNQRPIYLCEEWIADGFKVARNGFLLAGTGYGVDILDPLGILLVRIQTSFIAVNVNWAGENLDELWIVGMGAIARVTLKLQGPALF
ncbi:hypothetical protein B7494_g546 [Chlorociboria aeruginascens]|nr:hypothetical protein B7494_g546 [Chlorociboria aeruginascens]